ncbi:14582_t:CDS:2, partial [Gigaspora rosea]
IHFTSTLHIKSKNSKPNKMSTEKEVQRWFNSLMEVVLAGLCLILPWYGLVLYGFRRRLGEIWEPVSAIDT